MGLVRAASTGVLCLALTAVLERHHADVIVAATHAIFSGPAIERIRGSQIDEVVITDTIPLTDEAKACPRIRQLSCAQLLAETMTRVSNEESVSSLFTE